jgi:uncharacterized membrane protein YcaP (DUF421 family)
MNVDWGQVFLPTVSVLELLVRASVSYLALFLILRIILNRQAGTMNVTDLLVVVLLGSAIQTPMTGGAQSLGDGLIVVVTIIVWSYILDWLGYRFPFMQRFIRPKPLLLVKNGRLIRRNMERELITESELKSALRKSGVLDIKQVKAAYMEGDGQISVISAEGNEDSITDHSTTP